MSLDFTADANAVREPSSAPVLSNVLPFPDRAIVRDLRLAGPSADQVAVTHRGETILYDCPADLHAAVLVRYAERLDADQRAAVDRALAAERAAVARAEARRLQVRRLQRRARLQLALRYALVLAAAAGAALVAGGAA